jgi:hypothetical protein
VPRYSDLALGAGTVLVVGLGALALRPHSLPSPPEGGVEHTAQSTPTASASPKASPSARPTGGVSARHAKATSWVVGAGDGLVVFAARQGCDAEAPTDVTVVRRNGAASTYAVKGLAAVGGIEVLDGSHAVLLGVDADCKQVGFATKDGGRTWSARRGDPAIWSLVPGVDDQVHAPSGLVDVPCAPRSVTGLDDRVARLGCTDGRLLGTVSGGEEWSILGNNRRVETVGFVSATTALALVDDPACKGTQIERSTDGGTDFKAAYCVEGDGPWGLYTDADVAVVVGGGTVARSTDDGATWAAQQISS